MAGNETGRWNLQPKYKTLEIGDRVFAISVQPKRRLDGSATRAVSWDVAQRQPRRAYLGCGTAASRAKAEAEIDAVIARHAGKRA